jgi:hypothetical protein
VAPVVGALTGSPGGQAPALQPARAAPQVV